MTSHLAKYFRQARESKGFRFGQLARLCGYRNVTKGANKIVAFERWGRRIHLGLLMKMADALGIDHATAEAYTAWVCREWHTGCCLVLSRRFAVWFRQDGSIEGVTEAIRGQSHNPYLLKLRRKTSLRPVDHDYAVQHVQWPKKPEIHEVTTDFGGVRLRSTFQIVEDKPGQVSINIEGPLIEFPDDEEDTQ